MASSQSRRPARKDNPRRSRQVAPLVRRPRLAVERLEGRLLLDTGLPNLAVTDLAAPAAAQRGELIDVAWAVVNRGDAATPGTPFTIWSDGFFFSADAAWDPSDLPTESVYTRFQPLEP